MSGTRDVTVVTTQKFSVITPRMAPRKPEDDPYDCINMQQQPATRRGADDDTPAPQEHMQRRASKGPWTHNEHWRRGVQIVVRNFPDGPRLRQETDIRIPRCVVSCRTPNHPDLPSAALLVAAANPMTVAEHVEAGTLRVGRRDPNVPAELYGDDRSDLSDWEDY